MAVNSKERILRNRNIALMRLYDKKNPDIRKMLVEHFWQQEDWPDHIVNCFMRFKYSDRICICNFFFGNGLQLNVAFNTIKFYHKWNWAQERSYRYTFTQLWIIVESAVNRVHINSHHILSTYYFYSMNTRSVLFFDGSIRMYGNKINVLHNPNISNERMHIPHRRTEEVMSPATEHHFVPVHHQRDRAMRLERRWKFLASVDGDPVIIDGFAFKFDYKLYTNNID